MSDSETKLVEELVTANRILANEDIIDIFGHISVRSARNPQEFLLSCSRSPAAVTASDILRYRLDCSILTKTSEKQYAERVIHGAIFQARPEVQAVCHTHSEGILPFACTGEPIRPVIHVGTMFWKGVGWFEKYDKEGNMLVASVTEGKALAKSLGSRKAALLKSHGCVVAGNNLRETLMGAIYIDRNARVQLEAMRLGKPFYIEGEDARRGATVFEKEFVQDRAWGYWLARLPKGWEAAAGVSVAAPGSRLEATLS